MYLQEVYELWDRGTIVSVHKWPHSRHQRVYGRIHHYWKLPGKKYCHQFHPTTQILYNLTQCSSAHFIYTLGTHECRYTYIVESVSAIQLVDIETLHLEKCNNIILLINPVRLISNYLDFEVLWWFKRPGKTRIIVEHPVKYVTEIRRKIMKYVVSLKT